MQQCPYCNHELNGPATRRTSRTNSSPGHKSTGIELVSCPNCGGIIDGFTSH